MLAHELQNIFLAVEFVSAWRQQQERDIARHLESLGAMPAGLIEEDDCAADYLRIRTTSRLHNRGPLDTESATNLPSQFAGSITANFIGRAMRLHGGRNSTSIRFQSRSDCGGTRGPTANWLQEAKAPSNRGVCQVK